MGLDTSPSDGPIEPKSLEDVEKLIQQFYAPGQSQESGRIHNALQKVQRSSEGWQLADALLRSRNDNVRFFGALTFLIKINHDWDSLNDQDAFMLLNTLIQWLIQLCNSGAPKVVIKKLCSALVSYYLRPSGVWKQCVRHLVLCMNDGEVIPVASMDHRPPTSSVVPSLSLNSTLAILWFARSLAEEVGKAYSSSLQTHKYYNRVSTNLEDVVAVLDYSMKTTGGANPRVFEESVSCFHDWIGYAHRAWVDKAITELGLLRQLTPLAMIALYQDDMYGAAVELFTDVLTNFPAFFTRDDFITLSTLLTNSKAQDILSRLKEGDFDMEVMSFARLLLAYGDAAVQDLAQKINDVQLSQVMRQLLDLLSCDGYPGVEDEICSEAMEFWITYTEFLIDSLFSAGDQQPIWMHSARRHIEAVIEACWVKIRYPPEEVIVTWDSDAKTGLKTFRGDVEDLIQSSYTLLGVDIFGKFAQLAIQTLQSHAWLQLEATLFCLNALSDSVADEEMVDHILSNLLGSSLFVDMTNATASIPAKTRQTAVTMITRFTTFFERHVEHLPAMLNFLFESLKAPALATVAARAISSTCSTCRKSLTSEVGAFLQQYGLLLSWNSVNDSYVKEKIMGAIAAIIQAIPAEEGKLAPLSMLVQFVEQEFANSMEYKEDSQAENYQESATCALRCLASMGKALQKPDDVAIDLEEGNAPQSRFWIDGEGASLQKKIIQMLKELYGQMSWNSDVVEASCQVLRSGYTEKSDGLFVFPLSVTVDLVMASSTETSRLDYLLDTAAVMLNRQSGNSDSGMRHAASSFLIHVLDLIESMTVNNAFDPEVAASSIELAQQMIPRYLHCIIRVPNIEKLFEFSLNCLNASDILPKRAAAYFWSAFVQKHELPAEDTMSIEAAMKQYGPRLCHILVRQIGGEAARSELDVFAEPLKRLIFAQPQAKQWLASALDNNDFPSKKVGPTEKRMWLQKVMNLRGAKGTNQAVKDFWIACRGAEFAYA